MVHRPVNIQGTRNWLQHFRGDIMNQPYLTCSATSRNREDAADPQLQHSQRGRGPRVAARRSDLLVRAGHRHSSGSVSPAVVQAAGDDLRLRIWAASQGHSVAFLSHLAIADMSGAVPLGEARYLEIVTATDLRIYGVHLSAVTAT